MEKQNIYQKINEFRGKVGKVRKDANNPFHKSKYASIESVLETVEDKLLEVGLAHIEIPQETGMKMLLVNVDKPEEQIEGFCPYFMTKQDMQSLGSAQTYARRYLLVSMLGLEQEDDDGNRTLKPKNNGLITEQQHQELRQLIQNKGLDYMTVCSAWNFKNLSELLASNIVQFKDWVNNQQ